MGFQCPQPGRLLRFVRTPPLGTAAIPARSPKADVLFPAQYRTPARYLNEWPFSGATEPLVNDRV